MILNWKDTTYTSDTLRLDGWQEGKRGRKKVIVLGFTQRNKHNFLNKIIK